MNYKALLILLAGLAVTTGGNAQLASSAGTRVQSLLTNADYYLFRADLLGQADSASTYVEEASRLNEQLGLQEVTDHILALRAYINQDRHPDDGYYRRLLAIADTCRSHKDKKNERLVWSLAADAVQDGDSDSVKISAYMRAATLAESLGDREQVSMSRMGIVKVYMDRKQNDTAEKMLDAAIADSKGLGHSLQFGYYLRASIEFSRGKMDSALWYALRSEELQTASGDSTYITNIFNTLSNIYYATKQPEKGIAWAMRALQHCLSTRKTDIMLPILNSIVANYIQLGRVNEALALVDREALRVPLNTAEDRRILQKMYGKIYLTRHEYEKAEGFYRRALAIGMGEGVAYGAIAKGSDLRALGIIAYETKQYPAARLWLDSALSIWAPTGRMDFLSQIHQDLCLTDSAMGNYASALRHLRAADQISAVIFNRDRDKQIQELNLQYKTAEREKDLQLLYKEQQMAAQELGQARVTRNGILLGSMLLVIFSALLYRENRKRRLANRTITDKNLLLEKLVGEKEWLLKEVHHRVKNNLHMIVGLLESQAARLDSSALKAIEVSQHRVHAMSLVHQKLYRQDDLRTIDMSLYLRELVLYLAGSFGSAENIHAEVVASPLSMDVSRAISVGMITNEAVTNAFKYAFSSIDRGVITVRLYEDVDRIVLSIADNGIGMKLPTGDEEVDSLGIELMEGFARDLNGTISFDNACGTKITVAMPMNHLN